MAINDEGNILSKTVRRLGLREDVKTGNSNFDERFRVKTSDPKKCREILSGEIQLELLGIDRLELRCEGEQVRILSHGILEEPAVLDKFLQLGKDISHCVATSTVPAAPPPPAPDQVPKTEERRTSFSQYLFEGSTSTADASSGEETEANVSVEAGNYSARQDAQEEVRCPECRQTIAENLLSCPFCGHELIS